MESLTTLFLAPPGTLSITLLAGVFGLLIGSFLNVVIHRLPIMLQREFDAACAEECGKEVPQPEPFNLAVPRSACPHCGHKITASENIPVLSYLALGGRCSGCKAKISLRYPAVELFTAVLTAFIVWKIGAGWEGLAAVLFGFLMIAMTGIDLDTMYLPDDLTYPLLWLGLLVNLNGAFTPLRDAVIGAVAGFMVLYLIDWAYRKVKGVPVAMGGGDMKLLAGLGAWFGWSMLPAVLLMASIVGSVVGIYMIVFGGNSVDKKIPFGPYLAGAGLITLLWLPQIEQLMAWYLQRS